MARTPPILLLTTLLATPAFADERVHGHAEDDAAGRPAAARPAAIVRTDPARRFGVELNPYGLLLSIGKADDEYGEHETYLTGTVSAALGDNGWELAAPFAVIDYIDFHGRRTGSEDESHSLRRVDLQLRRFSGHDRQGAYAGVLARFSRYGDVGTVDGDDFDSPTLPRSADRAGAGIVLGYRVLATRFGRRLYVGANLHLGRWLDGGIEHDPPFTLLPGPSEAEDDVFFNVEFAKVGLRF